MPVNSGPDGNAADGAVTRTNSRSDRTCRVADRYAASRAGSRLHQTLRRRQPLGRRPSGTCT